MKFVALLTVLFGMSFDAHALTRQMNCKMGDIGQLQLNFELMKSGSEKVTVVLTDEEGIPTDYINSHFEMGGLLNDLAMRNDIDLIVSTTDLDASYGGAILDAGSLSMYHNPVTKRWDVMFAAAGHVFNASCL